LQPVVLARRIAESGRLGTPDRANPQAQPHFGLIACIFALIQSEDGGTRREAAGPLANIFRNRLIPCVFAGG
jgi:hypothetical protein